MLGANSPTVSDGMPGRARNRARKKNRQEVVDEILERGFNLDETLEKNINRVIVEAMGSRDRIKIKNLVDRMHSTDIGAIMDFLKENTPGIDTGIESDCPHCRATMNVSLPITETFFRPKKRGGIRS